MNKELLQKYTNVSLDDLPNISSQIIKYILDYKIFLLDAKMASGKTTLVKNICEQLNVDEVVVSPTYGLINEYFTENLKIYHLDLYRLNSLEEFYEIVGDSFFYEENSVFFVEWFDLVLKFLPKEGIIINIQTVDWTLRNIEIYKYFLDVSL